MEYLEGLDVSWNKISCFIIFLLQLKANTPELNQLDVRYNCIVDLHNVRHMELFVNKYIPELVSFNGQLINKMQGAFMSPSVYLTSVNKLPRAIYRLRNIKPLTLASNCELCEVDNKFIGFKPHLGYNCDGILKCICVKGLFHFHLALSTLGNINNVQLIDFSNTGLDYTHYLKNFCNLVEINISNNLLRFIGTVFSAMPNLIKLNISRNYLTSVADLSNCYLPSLKVFMFFFAFCFVFN